LDVEVSQPLRSEKLKLLDMSAEIRAFIAENEGQLNALAKT